MKDDSHTTQAQVGRVRRARFAPLDVIADIGIINYGWIIDFTGVDLIAGGICPAGGRNCKASGPHCIASYKVSQTDRRSHRSIVSEEGDRDHLGSLW